MSNRNLSIKDIGHIATFPICADMSSEDAKIFIRHLNGMEYEPEEEIFKQGETSNDHLFILLDGFVKLTTRMENFESTPVALNKQGPHDVIGILSFIDGRQHWASAHAVTSVRAAIVTRDDYQHFKDYHPSVAASLLQYLIVIADDLACQLLIQLSETQAYVHGSNHKSLGGGGFQAVKRIQFK